MGFLFFCMLRAIQNTRTGMYDHEMFNRGGPSQIGVVPHAGEVLWTWVIDTLVSSYGSSERYALRNITRRLQR